MDMVLLLNLTLLRENHIPQNTRESRNGNIRNKAASTRILRGSDKV